MAIRVPVFFTVVLLLFTEVSTAQNNTERGAIAGGTAGAIIGGIIGNQNDETPEGILIGGALGALAGGLMGNDRDAQLRHQYYYQQQQRQRQVAAWQSGLSMNDVIAMSQNGVTSTVIINQIRMNGVQQKIGVNEIISLHQYGVDNTIIDAMQRAPLAGAHRPLENPAAWQQRPVRPIVVEQVYVPRPVPVYRPGYGPGYCPQRRTPYHYHPRGASIQFDFRR